jgi:hypothetical protein
MSVIRKDHLPLKTNQSEQHTTPENTQQQGITTCQQAIITEDKGEKKTKKNKKKNKKNE